MEKTITPQRPARSRGAPTIFESLREEIIGLVLPPGTVLSRHELQARFGLSATPIRDALLRLQLEGLVNVFPQHATMVSPIDLERARAAQFLRRSIELELVRTLALEPEKAPVAKLRSLIRQLETLAELQEYEAFNLGDQAFHRTMYEALGVADLYDLVRRQGAHIDRLRRLHLPVAGKMEEILKEHTAIVDAIAAGDPEAAQRALRAHLSRSLEFVETLKERFPQYFTR